MRSKFEHELKHLQDDIIEMSATVENSLNDIVALLKNFDETLVANISKNEKEVDELEASIQSTALKLLAFQQPVARDLRAISTALNIITDMERIADQTLDIAEILYLNSTKPFFKKPEHIIEMVEKCRVMVNKSLDSYVLKDVELANNVIESDDEVDDLLVFLRSELIEYIKKGDEYVAQSVDFIMIAKYLERIGDHAVNIAEWAIFNVTGEHKNNKIL